MYKRQARGAQGLVILTTLGTGIGIALLHNGVLIPNCELGHLEVNGHDAETRAASSAKEREGLGYKTWATERLQPFYAVSYTHLDVYKRQAPGCARSPKENGFDWVLQRILADVPVRAADIRRMGAGGLLMEIVTRPQPRLPHE